jgi:hypothetical protein
LRSYFWFSPPPDPVMASAPFALFPRASIRASVFGGAPPY